MFKIQYPFALLACTLLTSCAVGENLASEIRTHEAKQRSEQLQPALFYVRDNIKAITQRKPIVAFDQTIPFGNSVGQSLSPTIEQLQKLGYTVPYQKATVYHIKLEPTHCTLSSAACWVKTEMFFGESYTYSQTNWGNQPDSIKGWQK